jgi:hypothetical protein
MLPSVAPMRETYNLWILGDRTVFDIVLLLHAICFMPEPAGRNANPPCRVRVCALLSYGQVKWRF